MNIELRNKNWRQTSFRGVAGAAALAVLLAAGISGCKSDKAPIVSGANNPNGPDPADANMATGDGSQPTYVAGTSQAYTPQQSSENYGPRQQAPAPIVRGNNSYLNESQNPNAASPDHSQQQGYADTQQAYDQGYNNGEAEGVYEADQPPPALPEYDQPPAADDNDIWTPGYWGYANTGYYWTPGAWVAAPYVGALWTPGYWGSYGNRYRWHRGYWGRHVGYYGGINYGWGYIGTGYYGGYWNSNRFYYNRAITHVSPRVVTVYERPVVVNNIRYTSYTNNRVSYNGGRGGVNYQPRPFEVAAMHEQHIAPLPEQRQFHQQAQMNRANFFSENHGRPSQAALARPVEVRAVNASPALVNPGVNRGGFGRPGGQPGSNPAFDRNDHNNAQQVQRQQMEQQRAQQMHGQQNVQAEQQRGLMNQQAVQRQQMEQQRNIQNQQQQQAQQHNLQTQQGGDAHAEQQRNFQLQQQAQHNNAVADQQRNMQMQQQRQQMEQQHNIQNRQAQQQRNAAIEQQRNQQAEQQRSQQMEQRRSIEMQQRNVEMQQRNAQMQQQRNVQIQQAQQQQQQRAEQQRSFQTQQQAQPRAEQPHIEQPRVQAAPQPHFEQPRAQPSPQPQHVEQPHVQAAPQPHFEQHAAPAAPAGGGGVHPGGHH